MKIQFQLLCLFICILTLNHFGNAKRFGGGGSLSRGSSKSSSRRTGTNYGGVSKNRPAQSSSSGQLSHTNLASLSYAGYNKPKPASNPQPKPSAPELPKQNAPNQQNSRPIGWNVDNSNQAKQGVGFDSAVKQNAGSLNSQNSHAGSLNQQHGAPPPYSPVQNPNQHGALGPPPPYSPVNNPNQHSAFGPPPPYSPVNPANQHTGFNQAYQPNQGGAHSYSGHQPAYPNQGHNPNPGYQPGYPNQAYNPNSGYQSGYPNQGLYPNTGHQVGYQNPGYYGGHSPGHNYGMPGHQFYPGGYQSYPGSYGNRGGSSFLGFGSGLGIGSLVTGLALWSFARGSHSNNIVHVYDSRTGESSNITTLTHPCIQDIVNGTNATSVTVILAPNCTFVSETMQGANNFTIDTAEAQKELIQNGTESINLSQIGLEGFNLTGVNLTETVGNNTDLLHLNTPLNLTDPIWPNSGNGSIPPAATELANVDDAPVDINAMVALPILGVLPISRVNTSGNEGGGIALAEAGKDATQAQLATSGSLYVSPNMFLINLIFLSLILCR